MSSNTIVQEAGTTAWYRVAMEQLRLEHMLITARIGNMDGQSGRATVAFFNECGGEQLQNASSVVGANAVLEKTLSSALSSIVKGDWMYINHKEYFAVNLSTLQALAEAKNLTKIGIEELKAAGLTNGKELVKVLGNGELKAQRTLRIQG